jgi:hypothetical protein
MLIEALYSNEMKAIEVSYISSIKLEYMDKALENPSNTKHIKLL